METEGKKPAERSSGSGSAYFTGAFSPPFCPASLPLPPSLPPSVVLYSAFHPFPVFPGLRQAITLHMPMNKVSRRKKQTSLPSSLPQFTPFIPLPSPLRVTFSPVERFIRSLGGLSIQVLATIFQKKSKGRLGNLGEPPSPLDRRLYSARTCVRKCTRVRAAYVARYTRDTYTWSPRTSGIPGLDSRRRALRGRIYRVSPMRAQAARRGIHSISRGVGAQLFLTNSARCAHARW